MGNIDTQSIQKNNLFLPLIIIVVGLIFMAYVSYSLNDQLIDKDDAILKLSTDLNTELNKNSVLTGQVAVLNNNVAATQAQINDVTAQKNLLISDKNILTIQFTDVNSKYYTQNGLFVDVNKRYFDLNILAVDINSSLKEYKAGAVDVNARAKSLFTKFDKCYWAIQCDANIIACQNKYGLAVDIIKQIEIDTNNCRDISLDDLNIYRRYFQ